MVVVGPDLERGKVAEVQACRFLQPLEDALGPTHEPQVDVLDRAGPRQPNPAQELSWNRGLRFSPGISSGRGGIRTPDFCLRSPNSQPESPGFAAVLGDEPGATERDEAPLTPFSGPVVPNDIELSARRALADPSASDRELTLAQWILKDLG